MFHVLIIQSLFKCYTVPHCTEIVKTVRLVKKKYEIFFLPQFDIFWEAKIFFQNLRSNFSIFAPKDVFFPIFEQIKLDIQVFTVLMHADYKFTIAK